MLAFVKCPYCGTEDDYEINPGESDKYEIVTCGDNPRFGGGCDKPFAVKITVTALKIEGEDDVVQSVKEEPQKEAKQPEPAASQPDAPCGIFINGINISEGSNISPADPADERLDYIPDTIANLFTSTLDAATDLGEKVKKDPSAENLSDLLKAIDVLNVLNAF
jgi:hypothetical protein